MRSATAALLALPLLALPSAATAQIQSTWTGAASAPFWTDPANWAPSIAPNNTATDSFEVTLVTTVPTPVVSVAPVTIDSLEMDLTQLDLFSDLTVANDFVWTGGDVRSIATPSVSRPALVSQGMLLFDPGPGEVHWFQDVDLVNQGHAVFASGELRTEISFDPRPPGAIHNRPGAIFELRGGATVFGDGNQNEGIVRKTGPGSAWLNLASSSGEIQVLEGTLGVLASLADMEDVFIAPGATLDQLTSVDWRWTGGTISGGGQLVHPRMRVTGPATHVLDGTLVTDGFAIRLDTDLHLANGAEIRTALAFRGGSIRDGGGAASTLRGTSLLGNFSPTAYAIEADLVVEGVTTVQAGRFQLARGFEQVDPGSNLRFGNGTLESATPLVVGAGMVTGTGTLDADLTLGGTLSPSPFADDLGTLTIGGALTLTPDGSVEIDFDFTGSGVEADLVRVLGATFLAGELVLRSLPPQGLRGGPLVVLDGDAPVAGAFSNAPNGTVLVDNGTSFTVHYGAGSPYDPTDVVVTFVPEPGTILLLGIGLAALGARWRHGTPQASVYNVR